MTITHTLNGKPTRVSHAVALAQHFSMCMQALPGARKCSIFSCGTASVTTDLWISVGGADQSESMIV